MTLILKLGLLVHDHPFQIYYKVRQVLLQNATTYFITKCEQVRVKSCVMFLLKLFGSSLRNNESDGNEVVQTKISKGRQQICMGITILGLFLNDDVNFLTWPQT